MTDLIGLPSSKAVSTPSGFAQCYVHNVRRKAECCEMKPVFNADMEVVDYICVCKEAFTCKSASDRQSSDLAGEAVAGGARTDFPGGGSSGAAPLMIDASSTSMTAHSSSHHHRRGQPSAAGAVYRDAGVSTVFAVSFYSSSCTAPGPSESAAAAAAAGAVSENLSLKNGETKGDEHDEAPKTDVMTIGDSGSDDVDSLDNLPLPTTGAAPATAAPAAVAAGSPLLPPRGRQRYYDSIQNTGTSGSAPPVKVCWSCGMSGHEKPACPNSLCRTCHQKRGPYGSPHRCTLVVTPSPFIVYPTPSEWHAITLKTAATAGEPSGMEAVRCVACNEYGHFDCSTIAPPSSYALVASASTGPAAVPHTTLWTCCFCGVRGHTIFDCRQREQVNPDNFERRNQLIADAIRRRGSNIATGVPPNSSGSNSGFVYSSQQQHPQRSYGSPPSGAQSSASSFTRYGNDRAGVGSGGGQRRERDWRDERDQRLGGNPSGNSRREGGDWDNQRRRYESPSFSPAGGGSALPSSPLLHGRDRFQGNSYRHHAERSHDNYGGRRQTQSGSDRGGGASRGYDQRLHNSQPSPHHHDRLSHRGGRRRGGGSGYDSGDDLF